MMKLKLLTLLLVFVLISALVTPTNNPYAAALQGAPTPYDPEDYGPAGADKERLYNGYLDDSAQPGQAQPGAGQPEAVAPFHPLALAAGLSHTCAVSSEGGVKCWGSNSHGWLGDGTLTYRSTPVSVVGLSSGVVAISSSHKHNCVLTSAGGVKCWGYNLHGELGNGTTTDSLVPIDVPGLTSGVKSVTAGGFHTCALLTDGTVKCWGANWHGQLGDGTTEDRHSPVTVIGLGSDVRDVKAGKYHTCALTGQGVKCWGYNMSGQIGNGDTGMGQITPADVINEGKEVVAISIGALHSCSLTSDGSVRCWGDNLQGQLGDGTRVDRTTAVQVAGLGGPASAISAGGAFTCAILSGTGSVKCWGDNWAGQLGNGERGWSKDPVTVTGISEPVTNVETGDSHACAVTASAQVLCWGSNALGQVGDGQTALHMQPVDVAGLSTGVKAVYAGGLHVCALTETGGVKCWGNNSYGQLGDRTLSSRITPVDVYGLNSGVAAVAVGGFHTCALLQSGQVMCWGYNYNGQLGDGTSDTRTAPVAVKGLGKAVAITAGSDHNCALLSVGTIYCWGRNNAGQLGDGTKNNSDAPVKVAGISSAIAISSGEQHTCAILKGGAMKCWGNDFDGQLGDGAYVNKTKPVYVSGLSSAVAEISEGVYHSCALRDGQVLCWGGNYSGQLGNGGYDRVPLPAVVNGLARPASTISAGFLHTCALLTGQAWCWGDNLSGQLGGASTGFFPNPQLVPGTAGLVKLSAGGPVTCALTSAGGVKCWGLNSDGQVGDGSLPWQVTPSPVFGLEPTMLTLNHASGQPGSYFMASGSGFAPSSAVTVLINGISISQDLRTDSRGDLSFEISTQDASAGQYLLVARTGSQAAIASFVLKADAPLQARASALPLLNIPAGIVYLYNSYLPEAR